MGKREETTDISRVLKMPGQGWVEREHPSLCEIRGRKCASALEREVEVSSNGSTFLRRESETICQKCTAGGASSGIWRSFKR